MTEHIREVGKGSFLYEVRLEERLYDSGRWGDVFGVVAAVIIWILLVVLAMGVA